MVSKITILAFVITNTFALYAQEVHFKNTRQYLKEASVQERTTWDITDSITKTAIDKYDERGNKIEAVEIYEHKRLLSQFIMGQWTNAPAATRFTFMYNETGQQTEQKNYSYNSKQRNVMYRYDRYGNIERWRVGRSFENPRVLADSYDEKGNVYKTYFCWADSICTGERRYDGYEIFHYLKYDNKGYLIEDLVNYIDGMSGKVWEYELNKKGEVLLKKEYHVNSYFGLDHDTPTVKDIDVKKSSMSWEFEYDEAGFLIKEKRIEPYMEIENERIFLYNKQGLIVQEKIDNLEIIDYVYDNKNLLVESNDYSVSEGPQRLHKKLKYEYIYR